MPMAYGRPLYLSYHNISSQRPGSFSYAPRRWNRSASIPIGYPSLATDTLSPKFVGLMRSAYGFPALSSSKVLSTSGVLTLTRLTAGPATPGGHSIAKHTTALHSP